MSNNSRILTFCVIFLASCMSASLWAQDTALVQTCVACHGEQGIAPSGQWPNLAGQKREYLVDQIQAFRDRQRIEPLMFPMVKDLSDAQIKQLADYYTNLPMPERHEGEVTELGRHVRARCISCHGAEGITVNPEWPNLAGQNAEYLQKQLLDYRSGERKHLLMQVIAKELTNEEIEAVATYFSH